MITVSVSIQSPSKIAHDSGSGTLRKNRKLRRQPYACAVLTSIWRTVRLFVGVKVFIPARRGAVRNGGANISLFSFVSRLDLFHYALSVSRSRWVRSGPFNSSLFRPHQSSRAHRILLPSSTYKHPRENHNMVHHQQCYRRRASAGPSGGLSLPAPTLAMLSFPPFYASVFLLYCSLLETSLVVPRHPCCCSKKRLKSKSIRSSFTCTPLRDRTICPCHGMSSTSKQACSLCEDLLLKALCLCLIHSLNGNRWEKNTKRRYTMMMDQTVLNIVLQPRLLEPIRPTDKKTEVTHR